MADRVVKLQEQLQLVLGDSPVVTIEPMVNWAGTEYRSSVLACRPTTINEAQTILRACHSLKIHVRAVANRFCSSPLFPDEGQLCLYTCNLKRFDGPSIEHKINEEDPALSELTAFCSVTVHELLHYQLMAGIELPGNVLCRGGTVAGIVSTMAHGCGLHVQCVSDLILRMRILTSSGELRIYDGANAELFNAVKGCFGLFGIIYDVTFRVAPLSLVQVEDRWITVGNTFLEKDFMSALVHNNVSTELTWYPMNSVGFVDRSKMFLKKPASFGRWDPARDEVHVRTINRPSSNLPVDEDESHYHRPCPVGVSYRFRNWLTSKVPTALPMITHKMVSSLKKTCMGKQVQVAPLAIHYLADVDAFPVWQMGFVFNLDQDGANVHCAIMDTIKWIHQMATQGCFPVLKVSLRFTGASPSYLASSYCGSPACGGSGYVCHIDIESFVGTPGWHEFAARLGTCYMEIPGARPDWSKQWTFIPGIHDYVRKTCEKEIVVFCQQLENTPVDPGRIFFNSTLEYLLYGTGAPLTGPPITIIQEPEPAEAQPQQQQQIVAADANGVQQVVVSQANGTQAAAPPGYQHVIIKQANGQHQIALQPLPASHYPQPRKEKPGFLGWLLSGKGGGRRHLADDPNTVLAQSTPNQQYQTVQQVAPQQAPVVWSGNSAKTSPTPGPQPIVPEQAVLYYPGQEAPTVKRPWWKGGSKKQTQVVVQAQPQVYAAQAGAYPANQINGLGGGGVVVGGGGAAQGVQPRAIFTARR